MGGTQGPVWARLNRTDHFKHQFRIALFQVISQYPAAKIEGDNSGLTLFNSPPPVKKRMVLVQTSNQ